MVMSAAPGDRVVVRALHGTSREGEVVEARGRDGGPPYVVRWSRSGEESLLFPGPGTLVYPATATGAGDG
jgi:hypothetical protein